MLRLLLDTALSRPVDHLDEKEARSSSGRWQSASTRTRMCTSPSPPTPEPATLVLRRADLGHSGLAYRTPAEVAQTWKDGRTQLKPAA
jgi:hypothetical protein